MSIDKSMSIDQLDADLIALISEEAGISVVECARRLGIARATAQGRLDRLRRSGIISSMAPHIDPTALGYPIRSFCSILIQQSVGHKRVAEGLAQIPEIIELHTATGDADMMATIVAQSTQDLQRVFDLMSRAEGVDRVSSRFALGTHFEGRTLPLVRKAAGDLRSRGRAAAATGRAGQAPALFDGSRDSRESPSSSSE